MHQIPIFLLFLITAGTTSASSKEACLSEQTVAEQCSEELEYTAYISCMHNRRMKRDLNCDNNCEDCNNSNECDNCDCDECSTSHCSSACNVCCINTDSCESRSCCQQTCHSSCRTSSCRSRCRTKCNSKIPDRTKPSFSQSHHTANTNVSTKTTANITTIINLHNVINNTNVIDMPIHINNTNINNITVEAPDIVQHEPRTVLVPGQNTITYDREHEIQKEIQREIIREREREEKEKQTDTGKNCCKVVGPRQCTPTKTYPFSKCFHYRKQHCGNICKTSIMHAEPHQVCELVGSQQSCHQQIAYIPQPQPRCSWTSGWPYVRCGIQPPNCGGCYRHIVNGGSRPNHCSSSCYDQGIDLGPVWPRPGPMYQQDCVQQGTCGGGYYGNPSEMQYQIEPNDAIPYGINHISEDDIKDKYREGYNDFAYPSETGEFAHNTENK